MPGEEFILLMEHSIKHSMAIEEASETSFSCRGKWSGIISFALHTTHKVKP
jgi:hypothetical protein